MIYLNGKQISRLVQSGPQKDALAQSDIVFATPVAMAVAEKNFRETFRRHYIIGDESPRDKETTTLILLSHFSPKAYIFLGDHKQLAPLVFSTYQHRKYKPPRAFKPAEEEERLLSPATFALQLGRLMISRLLESRENCQARSFSNSGHVNFVLTHVVDLLGNHMFRPSKKKPEDGKIMIFVPYENQKNLYQYELQIAPAWRGTAKGSYPPHPKRAGQGETEGEQGNEEACTQTGQGRGYRRVSLNLRR